MTTIVTHTTRAAGTILTASIYNTDHVVHVTNAQNLNADKLEGATPPVVDGDAAVFSGTSGAALKTAGFAPANDATTISAGVGLTGGGDLSANRTISADISDQTTAETGTDDTVLMTPLKTADYVTARLADQTTAETGTDNNDLMTALRTTENWTAAIADQSTAEAGSNNTKLMTPLRVAEAIAALGGGITPGSKINISSSVLDMGQDSSMFVVITGTTSSAATGDFQVSCDGGSNYTTLFTPGGSSDSYTFIIIVSVDKGGGAATGAYFVIDRDATPASAPSVSVAHISGLTTGTGNTKFKFSGGSPSASAGRLI